MHRKIFLFLFFFVKTLNTGLYLQYHLQLAIGNQKTNIINNFSGWILTTLEACPFPTSASGGSNGSGNNNNNLFTNLSKKECRIKCFEWSECYAFRIDGTDCYIWTLQNKDECQISNTDSVNWVLIKSDKCN